MLEKRKMMMDIVTVETKNIINTWMEEYDYPLAIAMYKTHNALREAMYLCLEIEHGKYDDICYTSLLYTIRCDIAGTLNID